MTFPVNNQSYYLLNSGAPLVLDLTGGGAQPGTPCVGWTPHFDQSAKNRVWTFQFAGVSRTGQDMWCLLNQQSNTYLDLAVHNGTWVVGSPVPYHQAQPPTQWWYVDNVATPAGQVQEYTLVNYGNSVVAGLYQGGTTDGTKISADSGANTLWERWIPIPVVP